MHYGNEAGSVSGGTRQSSSGDVMGAIGDSVSTSSSGMAAANNNSQAGRLASTLLAKHVRTLEVLYSLQRENAKIRQEGQEKSDEEESQRMVAEAVAAAVAGPNKLVAELQSQIEKLLEKVGRLEKDLCFAKETSANILGQASSQMDELRIAKEKLQVKCSDLEFKAEDQAQQVFLRGELVSKLSVAAAALLEEEKKTSDLMGRLKDSEAISGSLRGRIKEREKSISLMQATESSLRTSVDAKEIRVSGLETRARELQENLDAADTTRKIADSRLAQALRGADSARKELADRASIEQELLEKADKLSARADAAESKLAEERTRSQRLHEEGKRRLEEGTTKYNETLASFTLEREQLLNRVDALSHELLTLRAHMNNNRPQFSKYVEAKTENCQLKEELDGLREMIPAPRPSHRSISNGYGTNVIVERLRHSISVARSTAITTNNAAPVSSLASLRGDGDLHPLR